MSRAVRNKRLGATRGASAERKPTQLGEGKGNGVVRKSGTERPQPATANPTDIADPQARVIKTRS